MKVVIRMTGSIFDLDREGKISELLKIKDVIKLFHEKGNHITVITGGGRALRRTINVLRRVGAREDLLDYVGIETTRVNAFILISLLGEVAHKNVPRSIRDLILASETGKVVVAGGLIPGISTDAVSALAAEALNADILILMSRAGGIYDKDPEKYNDAKKMDSATMKKVREVTSNYWGKAGEHPLLDHVAIEVMSRSKIPAVIIPPNSKSLKKALEGEKIGTRIKHQP